MKRKFIAKLTEIAWDNITPLTERNKPVIRPKEVKSTNVHTIETMFKRLFPTHYPHELR